MATENINTNGGTVLYNTQIPHIGTDADIQKAFIAYHYGNENFARGTNKTGDAELDKALIVQGSIAWYLTDLQDKINDLSVAANISKTIISKQGDIVAGLSNDTAGIILAPDLTETTHNGKVLTIDNDFSSVDPLVVQKITWKLPSVTADNVVTLKSKSLDRPEIVDASGASEVTGFLRDANGAKLLDFANDSGTIISWVKITNSNSTTPIIAAEGGTNVDLILNAKGTGLVKVGGTATDNTVATTGTAQTLTNKTINSFLKDTYTVTVPSITANQSLVLTDTAQTLKNKAIEVRNTIPTFQDLDKSKTFSFTIDAAAQSDTDFTLPAPASSATVDTLVSLTSSGTLTNKTLTSPVINTQITSTAATMSLFPSTVTTLNIGGTTTATTFTGRVNNANSSSVRTEGLFIGTNRVYIGSSQPSYTATSGDIWIRI